MRELLDHFGASDRPRQRRPETLIDRSGRRRRLRVLHDCDRCNEAVATPRNVDDVAVSFTPIAERAAQCRDVNRKVGGANERVRPDPCDELLFADQLSRAFEQRDEDIESATAEMDRLLCLHEQPLPRQQPEGAEQNQRLGWATDPICNHCHFWLLYLEPRPRMRTPLVCVAVVGTRMGHERYGRAS